MTKLTVEERHSNLDKFYLEMNLDKNKILKINEGYACVCCFCSNLRKEGCDRSCCRMGIKCANFSLSEESAKDFLIK